MVLSLNIEVWVPPLVSLLLTAKEQYLLLTCKVADACQWSIQDVPRSQGLASATCYEVRLPLLRASLE